jgi:enoyl-CoA hydratase/carnithine racemase
LQRLIGYQRAAELVWSGRIVKAEEALQLGIVLEITAPENLLPRVSELAAKIAAKPPLAVRYSKRLMKLAQNQPLPEHLDICASFQALCHKTEDHAEALKAFFEKRPGVFQGR